MVGQWQISNKLKRHAHPASSKPRQLCINGSHSGTRPITVERQIVFAQNNEHGSETSTDIIDGNKRFHCETSNRTLPILDGRTSVLQVLAIVINDIFPHQTNFADSLLSQQSTGHANQRLIVIRDASTSDLQIIV